MPKPYGSAVTATVHLVRHGEVANPMGVIYGRLPGYNLSERGQEQARQASKRLEHADIGAVWASPLERAQETAEIIAAPHRTSITTDERLVESATTLEGAGRTLRQFITSPRLWWSLRNPWRPSWGETFSEIRVRMVAAIRDAIASSDGRDVVLVSHQTPVQVARLGVAERKIPPWLAFAPCETGSVTTLLIDGDVLVSASYFAPKV
ncbi:MAG: histidine phosphatase family protein [Actinomycetota bacterium]